MEADRIDSLINTTETGRWRQRRCNGWNKRRLSGQKSRVVVEEKNRFDSASMIRKALSHGSIVDLGHQEGLQPPEESL